MEAGASGFLRIVKKPTAMGMMIIMTERQRNAYPKAGGVAWVESPRVKLPLPEILPIPITHVNRPQQPQINAVAMVAIMPVFLLFILFSC